MKVAEFAKMAGVSRPAIYKAIKSGRLPPLVDGQLDPSCPDSRWFLEGHDVRPDGGEAGAVPEEADPEATESGITTRSEVELRKTEAQAKHWELKNARERGELIDRELVAKAIEITDSEHRRLLADGAQTIAKVTHDLVRTDATKEEVIEAVREEISGFLKSWKRQIARQLKMFYDETT